MADISRYLQAIQVAVYGEEVRGSIHDAIEIINAVGEKVLTMGGGAPTSAAYENSLYIDATTFDLYKYVSGTWTLIGTLKGDDGEQGPAGVNGNRWFRGAGISGKSPNPTVYSGSGVDEAFVNDNFINPTEGAVYHCTQAGDATTALWVYDFTLSGGGGGGASEWGDIGGTLSNQTDLWTELGNKVDKVAGKGLSENDYTDTDKAIVDGVTSALASKADSSTTYTKTEVDTALADKANTSQLDSWTPSQTINVTGDSTVTFTVDTTGKYEAWFESADGSQIALKSSSLIGTTYSMTVNVPSASALPVSIMLLKKGI